MTAAKWALTHQSISAIFDEIKSERWRQEEKWGEENHHPPVYYSLLQEEAGEVAKAINEGNSKSYREELIHLAAVAVAMIESFDRKRECHCGKCKHL